jgi:hypothetical protein
MLSLEKTGLVRRRLKLACNPPEEIDKSWERDGIPKKASGNIGKRALWAESVLALVPPSHWSRRLGVEPSALIAAIEEDRFAGAVLAGWTRAAAQFSATDAESAVWLSPLASYWVGVAGRVSGAGRNAAFDRVESLMAMMEQSLAESTVYEVITGQPDPEGLRLLTALTRPWTEDFGLRYLELVRNVLQRLDDNRAYQWMNTLGLASRALPSSTFAAALEPWEVKQTAGSNPEIAIRETERFAEAIQLRHSYFAELAALDARRNSAS